MGNGSKVIVAVGVGVDVGGRVSVAEMGPAGEGVRVRSIVLTGGRVAVSVAVGGRVWVGVLDAVGVGVIDGMGVCV